MECYDEQFYREQCEASLRSAREIVPLVLELIRPRSVIDVGCGVGAWLSVFRERGVDDIWGVDDHWVDRKQLQIPEERLQSHDLKKPFRMDRQFDLVVALEVAEHLPEACAETFLRSLTGLGKVILFSAAIPYQGGTNHLNEQWPDYWAARFRDLGWATIDCLRRKIWRNEKVDWWYAQNILLFAREDALHDRPALRRAVEETDISQLSVVHPKKYLDAIEWDVRLELARRDLEALVPPGESLILVDEDQFGSGVAEGRRALPFPERDGQYWGPPPDDAAAIRELERLRTAGAGFVAFGWPAFWWLEHYAGLHHHLRSKFRCVLENDRLRVFDLREAAEARRST